LQVGYALQALEISSLAEKDAHRIVSVARVRGGKIISLYSRSVSRREGERTASVIGKERGGSMQTVRGDKLRPDEYTSRGGSMVEAWKRGKVRFILKARGAKGRERGKEGKHSTGNDSR